MIETILVTSTQGTTSTMNVGGGSTVIDASQYSRVELQGNYSVLSHQRVGNDLHITGPNSEEVVLKDFFPREADGLPELVENGKHVSLPRDPSQGVLEPTYEISAPGELPAAETAEIGTQTEGVGSLGPAPLFAGMAAAGAAVAVAAGDSDGGGGSVSAAAPTVLRIEPDTGKLDDRTKETKLTAVIESEPGVLTVEVYDENGVKIHTVAVGVSQAGEVDVALPELSQGNFTLRAILTNTDGNTSDVSAAFDFEIDTTPPNAPTVSGVTEDENGRVTVSGTAKSGEEIVIRNPENDQEIARVKVGDDNTFTAEFNKGDAGLKGEDKIEVVAVDDVGNESTPVEATIPADTVAPDAPVIERIIDDTGELENHTNDSTLTVEGRVGKGAELGDRVDWTSEGPDGTVEKGVTRVIDMGGGKLGFRFDLPRLTEEGAYKLSATVTSDGNTSDKSPDFTFTFDTTPPPAEAWIKLLSLTEDTGLSDMDFITGKSEGLVLHGEVGRQPSDDLIYKISIDGGPAQDLSINADGTYDFPIPGELGEGGHTAKVWAEDGSGNVGVTDQQHIEIDTTKPDITLNETDGKTVSGATEPGVQEVRLDLDGDGTDDVTIVPDEDGTFSHRLDPSQFVADGKPITGTAVDVAGNEGTATVTVDTAERPEGPTVEITGMSDDTGASDDDFLTRDTTPVVHGRLSDALPAGQKVTARITGGPEGDEVDVTVPVTVEGDNSFDIDLAQALGEALEDGQYTVDVRVETDGGELVSEDSQSLDVDDTAPLIAAEPSDGRAVSGATEAGALVAVDYDDDGTFDASTTADASGNFTLVPGTRLADGQEVALQATDGAGNETDASVTVDYGQPTPPPEGEITHIVPDNGVSGTDFITNVDAVTVHGTVSKILTSDQSAVLLMDGQEVATLTVTDGRWSHRLTNLAEGDHDLRLEIRQAGNVIDADDQTMKIDLTAPIDPPTIAITQIMIDSGDPRDFNTNETELTVKGTLSKPLGNGQYLYVSNDGGQTKHLATVDGLNWLLNDQTVHSEGTFTYTAWVENTAGNKGPEVSRDVTIDLTAPNAPEDVKIDADSATGKVELKPGEKPGDITVKVTDDNGNEVGSGTLNPDGTFDIAIDPPPQDNEEYTLVAVDKADNTSPETMATADTVAPPKPTITGYEENTGVSATDKYTMDDTPNIFGKATGDAQEVELYQKTEGEQGLGTLIATVPVDALGDWAHQIENQDALADGSYIFTAVAVDGNGNTSDPSDPLNIVVDTNDGGTNPTPAPTIDDITDDTGISDSDNDSQDNTPTLHGTAEPNSIVTITRDGVPIGSTTADPGDGSWSLEDTGDDGNGLPDGTYQYRAQAQDPSGNDPSALSGPVTWKVDNAAPGKPVIDQYGGTGPIEGDGEAGALVKVDLDDDGTADVSATVGTDGRWSATPPGGFNPQHGDPITAWQEDPAGNVSDKDTINVDSQAPNKAVFVRIEDDNGPSSSDNDTDDNTLKFHFRIDLGDEDPADLTAEMTLRDTVNNTTTQLGPVSVAANGSIVFDHTGTALADGDYEVTATVTDGGKNTSQPSDPELVRIRTGDSPPPPDPTIDGIRQDTGTPGDFDTTDTTLEYFGKAPPRSVNEIKVDGMVVGTVVADANGDWSYQTPDTDALAVGSHTVTVTTIEDVFGRGPFGSDTKTVTIESGKAGKPTIDGIDPDTGINAHDGITNATTVTVNGTGNPGEFIKLQMDGTPYSTTATVESDGTWSIEVKDLKHGRYDLVAHAHNPGGGDPSDPSDSFSLDIDTQAPPTPDIDIASPKEIAGTVGGDAAYVEVVNETTGQSLGTVIVDPTTHKWQLDPKGLVGVGDEISATATDSAGNVSNPARKTAGTLLLGDLAWVSVGYGDIDVFFVKDDATLDTRPLTTKYSGPKGTNGFKSTFLADVTGDGISDLVYGNDVSGDDSIDVYAGLADGHFSTAPIKNTGTPGDWAGTDGRQVTFLRDVTGDGILDWVNGNQTRGSIIAFEGLGGGRFARTAIETPNIEGEFAGVNGIKNTFLGDVNNDGILDWVYGNVWSKDDSIRVFLGLGGGRFAKRPIVTPGMPTGRSGEWAGEDFRQTAFLADATEDGNLDWVYGIHDKSYGNHIMVFEGLGNGHFNTTPIVTSGMPDRKWAGSNLHQSSFLIDANNDGHLDWYNGDDWTSDESAIVFFGHGDGTFDTVGRKTPGMPKEPWAGTRGDQSVFLTRVGGSKSTHSGNAQAEDLIGDDTGERFLNVGAGDSVIANGGDDDVFLSDLSFDHIAGGDGEDRLVISGGGITLDMNAVGDVTGIEIIDITGIGSNELILTEQHVQDLPELQPFLRIDADEDDIVHAAGFLDQGTDAVIDGGTYDVYVSGSATLLIDHAATVNTVVV